MSRKNFTDAAAGDEPVKRGKTSLKIYLESHQLRSPALRYAGAIIREILGITEPAEIERRINLAAPKSLASLRRKISHDYNGDSSKVKDSTRLTIYTFTDKELEALMTNYGAKRDTKPFNKKMQEHGKGYSLRQDQKDYITNPKRWGYMALYLTIEYEGKPFEVQIYPAAMREAYKKTHELYEQVRASVETWQQSGLNIHKVLKPDEIDIMREILRIHNEAALACGLLKHAKSFPVLEDPPPPEDEVDITDYPESDMHDMHIEAIYNPTPDIGPGPA